MLREWLKSAGNALVDCVIDAIRGSPQGIGRTFEPDAKEAYGVFITLLVFVATQGGALTLTDQLAIPKGLSLVGYILLSIFAIALTQRLLRLPSPDAPLYYDHGTVVFGKFVFYVSIFATIALSIAYWKDWLSPNRPAFKDVSVPMTTPVLLSDNAERNGSLVQEMLAPERAMSLQLYADVLVQGLKHAKNSGDVYVCWSRKQFDKDYAGFRCELFDEIPDASRCIAFLHTDYRTDFADKQFALRLLHFETKKSLPTRRLKVGSPLEGDNLVLVFWSDKTFREEAEYSLKQVFN